MILISRLLNGSLCICVLRLSVFHVVKWYLIFPDFVPFREPFMTKKTVQRRSLTVVRPRSLDSVVIEAAERIREASFQTAILSEDWLRLFWCLSDRYDHSICFCSDAMFAFYMEGLELSCWGGVFLNCFIYYHLQLASLRILKDSRKKVVSTYKIRRLPQKRDLQLNSNDTPWHMWIELYQTFE